MTDPAFEKPVILMITGAWHPPILYDALKIALNARGYEWLCPDLATMGADKLGVTWHADVSLIHSLVNPLFDAGREVVIIGHSYGGIPACASTQGYTMDERADKGKKGGFRSIIYLAGFAIPEKGKDLLQTIGGSWAPWQDPAIPDSENQLMRVNTKAKHAFYNDLSPEEVQKCYDALVPHSQVAFETPVDFVVTDLTIPKAFIICELDQAMLLELQERLVNSISGLKSVRICAGHSPFLSRPEECAKLIAKLAQEL